MTAIAALQEYLPTDIKHAVMCWRRRAIWLKHGIIFIHVPKAAGTSIAHALYGRSLGHVRASDVRRYCPRTFEQTTTFAVSRNPWDRLVSAYHFVRQRGSSEAGVWRPEQYQAPSFRSFDAFVEEWLVEQDIKRLDYVFQPQHIFVEGGSASGSIVDFLGKVEDMQSVRDFLESATGRTLEITRRNESARETHYRTYYSTPRLIHLVGDLYRRDVELFDYDF